MAVRKLGNLTLLALADGQGGSAGGALAARLVTQTVLDVLESTSGVRDVDTLRLAVSVADEAVEAEDEAGYTTLIVIGVEANQVIGASVGDSQIWHIGESGVVELSERQRKNLPLGSGAALGTPFRVTVQEGEQILLMSDGVFRWVCIEDLIQTCRKEDDNSVLACLLAHQQPDSDGCLPDDWSAVLLRF